MSFKKSLKIFMKKSTKKLSTPAAFENPFIWVLAASGNSSVTALTTFWILRTEKNWVWEARKISIIKVSVFHRKKQTNFYIPRNSNTKEFKNDKKSKSIEFFTLKENATFGETVPNQSIHVKPNQTCAIAPLLAVMVGFNPRKTAVMIYLCVSPTVCTVHRIMYCRARGGRPYLGQWRMTEALYNWWGHNNSLTKKMNSSQRFIERNFWKVCKYIIVLWLEIM